MLLQHLYSDGKKNWELDIGEDVRWIVEKDKLFVFDRERIQCFFLENGKQAWQSGHAVVPPVVFSSAVGVFRDGGAIFAIYLEDGRQMWYRENIPVNIFQGSIAFIEDSTIFLGTGGSFFAMNLRNGDILWSIKMEHAVFFNKILTHAEAIFLAINGNTLVGIRKSDGSIFFRSEDSNSILHMATNQNFLYVLNGAGILSCYDPHSMMVVWRWEDTRKKNMEYVDFSISEEGRIGIYIYRDGIASITTVDYRTGKTLWKFFDKECDLLVNSASEIIWTSRNTISRMDPESKEIFWTVNTHCFVDHLVVSSKIISLAGDKKVMSFDRKSGKRKFIYKIKEKDLALLRLVIVPPKYSSEEESLLFSLESIAT